LPRIFTITYDVANHQRVDPIFCLTVVSLCIILNLHYLSSHIVAVRPLESATQENYFPFLNPLNLPSSIVTFSRLNLIPHISPPVLRIFASTSVAKHRSVLPIFSLTIDGLDMELQGAVDFTWFYSVVSLALGSLEICGVLWRHSLANSR
jgi:hypothetical protein